MEKAEPIFTTEGYIIGFDQCTSGQRTNNGAGFVIVANNYQDTLLTYNLPDSLYDFPDYLFAGGLYSPLFPGSARSKYRMTFSYRIAGGTEKSYPLCRGDILLDNPIYKRPQIIITKITNFTVDE